MLRLIPVTLCCSLSFDYIDWPRNFCVARQFHTIFYLVWRRAYFDIFQYSFCFIKFHKLSFDENIRRCRLKISRKIANRRCVFGLYWNYEKLIGNRERFIVIFMYEINGNFIIIIFWLKHHSSFVRIKWTIIVFMILFNSS